MAFTDGIFRKETTKPPFIVAANCPRAHCRIVSAFLATFTGVLINSINSAEVTVSHFTIVLAIYFRPRPAVISAPPALLLRVLFRFEPARGLVQIRRRRPVRYYYRRCPLYYTEFRGH